MGKRANIGDGTIMVVDDNPANVDLLSKMLTIHGCMVRAFTNSQFAMQSAFSNPPDLVLLDIRMPELDGFTFCMKLKENAKTSDIPVIFISALHETEDKVKAFDAGGVDYITKPFQEPEVMARVQAHIHIRTMQKQLETQNACLQAEVSQRTTAETALQKMNEELEDLVNNVQRSFNRHRRWKPSVFLPEG